MPGEFLYDFAMPLLANQHDTMSTAVAVAIGIAVVLVLVVVAVLLLKGVDALARWALARCYRGMEPHMTPTVDDVVVTYHTYHGFLVWFVETPHRVALPAEQARVLLQRLLWFNLTWGLLSYGAIFIPFVALGSYYAQRRSIHRQVQQRNEGQGPLVSESDPANPYAAPGIAADLEVPGPAPRPILHWVIGGVCGLLFVMFSVAALVNLFRADFPAAIGSVVIGGLLGLTARSYLFKSPTT